MRNLIRKYKSPPSDLIPNHQKRFSKCVPLITVPCTGDSNDKNHEEKPAEHLVMHVTQSKDFISVSSNAKVTLSWSSGYVCSRRPESLTTSTQIPAHSTL